MAIELYPSNQMAWQLYCLSRMPAGNMIIDLLQIELDPIEAGEVAMKVSALANEVADIEHQEIEAERQKKWRKG